LTQNSVEPDKNRQTGNNTIALFCTFAENRQIKMITIPASLNGFADVGLIN